MLQRTPNAARRLANPLRQRPSNVAPSSFFLTCSRSASPLQMSRSPFPGCMREQKAPDEFSSPCCEVREKTYLQAIPIHRQAHQVVSQLTDANQMVSARENNCCSLTLLHCLVLIVASLRGRKPKSNPSAGAELTLLFTPVL